MYGIAVGASGQVYLADSWNDRVVEFKVAGTPTPTPTVNPAVGLKASPKSIKVGHSAAISGLVKNFVSSDKAVTIYRKIGGKLTKLKSLTITGSGAFQWTKKMTKPGKWVLVATYKVGAVTYASKAVLLTVRKWAARSAASARAPRRLPRLPRAPLCAPAGRRLAAASHVTSACHDEVPPRT